MLFKDLLKVLVKVDCYIIRIDTYDTDKGTVVRENIFNITEIPNTYDNLKVLTIHTSDIYDSNHYQYWITVIK